jgi:hypothetical protein
MGRWWDSNNNYQSASFDRWSRDKNAWLITPNKRRVDNPLRMRVYFVGERFNSMTISPVYSDAIDVEDVGVKGKQLKRLALKDLKLGFQDRMRKLDNLEQRLIIDPDLDSRPSIYAMVVCDQSCERQAELLLPKEDASIALAAKDTPDKPADKPEGIEVRFERDYQPYTRQRDLERLVAENPFTQCLINNSLDVEVRHDDGDNEDYVWASAYKEDCALAWVTYDPKTVLATVNVNEWEALESKAFEMPKNAFVAEWQLDGRRVRDLAGTVKIIDADGHEIATADVEDGRVVFANVPFKGKDGKDLTGLRLTAEFEDYAAIDKKLNIVGVVEKPVPYSLTPLQTLANFYIAPTYQLLGESVSSDALARDKDCKYQLQVGDQQIDLMAKQKDRRWMLAMAPGSEAPRLEVGATVALNAHPTKAAKARKKSCLEPEGKVMLYSEDLDAGIIQVPIRHPEPWLLTVLTSADFPQADRLSDAEKQQERDEYWYALLNGVQDIRKKSDPSLYPWHFAQAVEGSSAGKATLILSGARSAADVENNRDDLTDLTEDDYLKLLLTPARAGGYRDGGSGPLPPAELENALSDFAAKNYFPIKGRTNAILLLTGDDIFRAGKRCTQFDEISKTLANLDIRLLQVVPVAEIVDNGATVKYQVGVGDKVDKRVGEGDAPAAEEDRAGDNDAAEKEKDPPATETKKLPKALERFSDRSDHTGVFVCNREHFGANRSTLIVYKRAGRSPDRNGLAAVMKSLEDLRTKPKTAGD